MRALIRFVNNKAFCSVEMSSFYGATTGYSEQRDDPSAAEEDPSEPLPPSTAVKEPKKAKVDRFSISEPQQGGNCNMTMGL